MLSVTMTSLKQILLFTEDQLTSSPEVFLVNPIQQQESDLVKKMKDTSGLRCLEQFGKFNRHGLWAKTFSALLIGMGDWYSKRCKLTWKLKGTKSNRMYFQLVPSTLPIEETEYGLLPTTKVGGKEGYETRAKRQGHEKAISHLEAFVGFHTMMLPTPSAMDSNGPKNLRKTTIQGFQKGWMKDMSLTHKAFLGLLPTPAFSDHKGASSIEALQARGRLKEKSDCLVNQFAVNGKSSQLNPQFVMEMMGFPPDWTELPFLNGERIHQSRRECSSASSGISDI